MVAHGFSKDERQAGMQAANAGVDMDMQGAVYMNHLKSLVDKGNVPQAAIDQAVRNILALKYDLGLFEDPYRYSDEKREKMIVLSQANLEAARRMARKSIVLLKNKNNTLPLRTNQKVALIGPFGNEKRSLIGSWSAAGDWTKSIPVLAAMQEKAPNNILYAKGCNINDDSLQYIESALQTARSADVVVLALGENWDMTGEAASRSSLGLPGVQQQLFEQIQALGKPVVVVLMNGRPLCIPELDQKADAILETWYLGTMAGPAITDVLYGDYNPSGRLTTTFPRSEGQIPVHYDMKNTGRPFDANNKYTSKYLDSPNEPLYPFGYGLSYTDFTYSKPFLNKKKMKRGEKLNLTLTITNAGKRAGEETVQLYIRDLVGSSTRPVKQLKAYQKINLQPGESKTITFFVDESMLSFFNYDLQYGAETGEFDVMVGPNSSNVQSIRFELQD